MVWIFKFFIHCFQRYGPSGRAGPVNVKNGLIVKIFWRAKRSAFRRVINCSKSKQKGVSKLCAWYIYFICVSPLTIFHWRSIIQVSITQFLLYILTCIIIISSAASLSTRPLKLGLPAHYIISLQAMLLFIFYNCLLCCYIA